MSCELFLNCCLLSGHSRSKEHGSGPTQCAGCIIICAWRSCYRLSWKFPPFPQVKAAFRLTSVHIIGCWPVVFAFFGLTEICKDQTLLEMARNRLQLLYQLLQSEAAWNMHWWQSIEEASVAFENIQYQWAISFTSPVWKDAFPFNLLASVHLVACLS